MCEKGGCHGFPTLQERMSGVAWKSLPRIRSTSCTSLPATRSCPCSSGWSSECSRWWWLLWWVVNGKTCWEEIDLLLTLDCLQLQQSRLSSIPESRDLWLRNQISDQNRDQISHQNIKGEVWHQISNDIKATLLGRSGSNICSQNLGIAKKGVGGLTHAKIFGGFDTVHRGLPRIITQPIKWSFIPKMDYSPTTSEHFPKK